MAPEPSDPLQIVAAVDEVVRRLSKYTRAAARDAGLTVPQALTLRALLQTPGPTPAIVAAKAGLSRSSMTSVLDRLEHEGLVRRERSALDRRKVMLFLTEVGTQRAKTLVDPLRGVLEGRLNRLSSSDLAQVEAGVGLLRDLLSDEVPPLPAVPAAL